MAKTKVTIYSKRKPACPRRRPCLNIWLNFLAGGIALQDKITKTRLEIDVDKMTIPILPGSVRHTSNGAGLADHLLQRCKVNGIEAALVSDLLPSGISLPIGPVFDETITAMIQDSSDYKDAQVQAWSKLVSTSPAIIILTPQYNWSFPGPLKNALDHLYHEWHNKSILLVTYGGHGGNKCADQLKQVLEGGLKAKLVTEPVMITLSSSFIRGDERINAFKDDQKEFRKQYEEKLDYALQTLQKASIKYNSEALS